MIDVLFGKVLYSNQLNFDTQEIIENIDQTRKSRNHATEITDNDTLYVLNKTKHKELKKIVDKEIKEFANNVMKYTNDFAITTSWFTEVDVMESGQFHRHSNSFLSGVLYLNVDEYTGNIIFENFDESITLATNQHNMLNAKSFTVTPKNGLILIFPSELWHTVGYNDSNIIRYSLAFNVMPVGTVGHAYDDSHMKIKLQ